MKSISTLFLFAILPIASVQAAGKYSKEVPKATVPTVMGGTITLDVRNVAAGSAVAAGTAPTTHSEILQISVGNLGVAPANVTAHWFWVGRYATSGNWYRDGEGEKALAIDSKKSEVVLAEGDVTGHVTKAAHEHYVSGGNLQGWVVTVKNSEGEIQAVKASSTYLQGFAIEQPPKKRK